MKQYPSQWMMMIWKVGLSGALVVLGLYSFDNILLPVGRYGNFLTFAPPRLNLFLVLT